MRNLKFIFCILIAIVLSFPSAAHARGIDGGYGGGISSGGGHRPRPASNIRKRVS